MSDKIQITSRSSTISHARAEGASTNNIPMNMADVNWHQLKVLFNASKIKVVQRIVSAALPVQGRNHPAEM